MCSPTAAAGDCSAGSMNTNVQPSGTPASASMRPSCPAPSTPTRSEESGSGIGVVEDTLGASGAKALQSFTERRMATAEDGGCEQRRVDGAGFADGERGHGD